MRQVLSISMPAQLITEVKKRIEKRGYSSISDYIKHLIKEDDGCMTDDEILKAAKDAEREYKQGKLKKLKSLDELM